MKSPIQSSRSNQVSHNRVWRSFLNLGLMIVGTTLLVACGAAAAPTEPEIKTPSSGSQINGPLRAELPPLQIGMGRTGISVTGESSMTLEPDLALLNIGVESTAETVAEARSQSAEAMGAVITALHSMGIEDKDIQTQQFNIWSRYEWREVPTESGFHTGKEVLVGYSVNNSASVKIRALDIVGDVIDQVSTAGGDHIRINGISFTVDNYKPLMEKLQEDAIRDATAKAQRFAGSTNVQLGKLVFLSDGAGQSPTGFTEGFAGARADSAYAVAEPTPISQGQLELRMTVWAVFDIQ